MSDRERPPRDSWVRIPKGSVLLDLAAVQQEERRLVRYAREVRGGILAAGYDIESIIDSILLKVFFPRPEDQEIRNLFDDLFLKRGSLQLARKLSILKKISSTLNALPDLKELSARLERVRAIRNEFAHYAISFVPEGPEPIRKLKATLAGPERDLDLTDEVVAELFEFFALVTRDLEAILNVMLGETTNATTYNSAPAPGIGSSRF